VETSAEQPPKSWWAETDMPVRTDSQVTFLIDGRHTMWTTCVHFLTASRYIYLANWGITPAMQLVRGSDHRAGPDGSPEQNALIDELQVMGLSAQDIQFWCTQELTVQNVLGYAVKKGVDVKVLLWGCPEVFSHYSPKAAHEQLTAVGAKCILDDSANRFPHPSASLHQKTGIIDGLYAFVGGIDPLIELSGDFDRWDTPAHSFVSRLRQNSKDSLPHTWHDAQAMIEGTAARDVEFNFYQRWNDVVHRHKLNASLLVSAPDLTPQEARPYRFVQVARTIPVETYSFAPKDGIQTISQQYAHAFTNVQHFLYLENQYFWLHAFLGLEIADFGPDNPEMERNLHLLAEALERGASLVLVLPDHPNVGRAFTDKGLAHLRKNAPHAAAAGRIQVYCLANSAMHDDKVVYRPVYVHAKVAIIDDIWSTIGSANLNNRGMRDDAEMNVAISQTDFAHNLRVLLWAEHLGLLAEDEQFIVSRYLSHQHLHLSGQQAMEIWRSLVQKLSDPISGATLLKEAAQANLQHFRNREPLVGHLFPYFSKEEAKQQGLSFHESHGLFETPENR
jgi:phosphatidylserine/phosphatidylglycerophosphate/cardiolipin synthase-like enzyme